MPKFQKNHSDFYPEYIFRNSDLQVVDFYKKSLTFKLVLKNALCNFEAIQTLHLIYQCIHGGKFFFNVVRYGDTLGVFLETTDADIRIESFL